MTSSGSTATADDTSIRGRQGPGRCDLLPAGYRVRVPGWRVDPPVPRLRSTPAGHTARSGCAEQVTRPRLPVSTNRPRQRRPR
jgi:hypothetical protein